MMEERIPVRIISEKPVGYEVEIIDNHSTVMIPKSTFIKRIEAGIYDVQNLNFLTKSL